MILIFRYMDLTCAGLNKAEVEGLSQIWKDRWIDSAKCDVEGNRLTLSVTDIDM